MGVGAALFVAGARRQASYRLALLSGVGTNIFFGLVRTALFLALFKQHDDVRGIDVGSALSYVWILQALFGTIWTSWMFELPDNIRSGDWVMELIRPGDPLVRHFAFEMGRVSYYLLVRAPLALFGASLFFELELPTTVGGWLAFAVSLVLGTAIAATVRFLIGTLAFWTPDYRGVFALIFMPIWFISGFLIPTTFFPPGLRTVAELSPFVGMLMAPVQVATGHGIVEPLTLQVFWVVVMFIACRLVLDRAVQRMVVFGG